MLGKIRKDYLFDEKDFFRKGLPEGGPDVC